MEGFVKRYRFSQEEIKILQTCKNLTMEKMEVLSRGVGLTNKS
jgi:hypothetical protein